MAASRRHPLAEVCSTVAVPVGGPPSHVGVSVPTSGLSATASASVDALRRYCCLLAIFCFGFCFSSTILGDSSNRFSQRSVVARSEEERERDHQSSGDQRGCSLLCGVLELPQSAPVLQGESALIHCFQWLHGSPAVMVKWVLSGGRKATHVAAWERGKPSGCFIQGGGAPSGCWPGLACAKEARS